jgi:precorrin-6B methylase 2
VADAIQCDLRGSEVLLDALAALRLLEKSGIRYRLAPGLDRLLLEEGPQTVLAMVQHQANCMRRWGQLARVVKTGRPAECAPSVRGREGDQASFIGAMDNISAPQADEVIQALQPLSFERLLDVGGASGTWTGAFLRACPGNRATLFDLPVVIPMADKRLTRLGLRERVELVPGDFMEDPLPPGADLAWVSAIVHQNSRAQNRQLFASVFRALARGGRIVIRDILMDANRTQPAAGALFAVNMLVATEGGGTFTFEELAGDLESVGFVEARVIRREEGMSSLVAARKP